MLAGKAYYIIAEIVGTMAGSGRKKGCQIW